MNVQRSPNIPELGLALFSACPDIEILEICDVKTDTCVFQALRNRVHGAKIFVHVPTDLIPGTDWFGTDVLLLKRFRPDMEDHIVMQEMYSAIRGMYRHSSPEQKQLLATHPSQVLRIQVRCANGEQNCIAPGWVKYLEGSVWFKLHSAFTKSDYRHIIAHIEVIGYDDTWLPVFSVPTEKRQTSRTLAQLPEDVWNHTTQFLPQNKNLPYRFD